MAVVYIVEDDLALRSELAKLLELNDYEVVACMDFSRASTEVIELDPDLVILDLKLPDIDGHEICREVRKETDVPIIVLTSSNDEFTEVMSLNLGAHDFVAKPYRPAVLLARISSLIRNHDKASMNSSIIAYGDVSLDLSASEVTYGSNRAAITRNEQRILALLMRNPEVIISRQELMCDLWESDSFIDDNTLTVNVNRLRKTLSSIGVPTDFLQTRRSLGYLVTTSQER